MQDTNWKTWLLIVLIAVGVMMEIIKRLPDAGRSAWDVENLRINNTAQPYFVGNGVMEKQRQQSQRTHTARPKNIGANQVTREQLEAFVRANAPTNTEFAHNEKGAEGKAKPDVKKKKSKNDEWEIVVDPKTGKRYKRKKKKKDPNAEEKKEEIAKEDPINEDPPKQKDEDTDLAIGTAIATGIFAPPPAKAKDATADLDEWIRRLLTFPDKTETLRFVDQYLNKKSVNAETFYKIVQMMLDDSRIEMKRLGLMALSLSPSVQSFNKLVVFYNHERTDSPLHADATAALKAYSQYGNLGIIERILRQPTSSDAAIAATQQLEDAARRDLGQSPTGTTANTNPPATTGTSSTNPQPASRVAAMRVQRYQAFVNVLQVLSKNGDPEVQTQAKSTLSLINRWIGTVTGQTTTPDPATGTTQPT